jgi:hypothetical protein
MLQLKNETPFSADLFLFPDPAGIDTLYVAVKATFEIGARELRVAAEPAPVVPADVHWGDPASSSIQYGGEAHPCKPATDVVLVGDGHAPRGRPAPQFGVSFSVGSLAKVIHVFGDRVWESSRPSRPAPSAQVPLRFERAYGGRQDLGGGRFLAEMRNPVGAGFLGKRRAGEMVGTPVPNLEHPAHPIKSPSDEPPPAGVGYIAPWWHPRATFAGTYDERWRKQRAPYLPGDFDARFFQAAPADQIYPGYLQGGEPVEVVNASPEGASRFALPACRLDVEVSVAGEEHRPEMRIETLLLEPGEHRFSLLWKGAVACDKAPLRVEEVRVAIASLEGAAS